MESLDRKMDSFDESVVIFLEYRLILSINIIGQSNVFITLFIRDLDGLFAVQKKKEKKKNRLQRRKNKDVKRENGTYGFATGSQFEAGIEAIKKIPDATGRAFLRGSQCRGNIQPTIKASDDSISEPGSQKQIRRIEFSRGGNFYFRTSRRALSFPDERPSVLEKDGRSLPRTRRRSNSKFCWS